MAGRLYGPTDRHWQCPSAVVLSWRHLHEFEVLLIRASSHVLGSRDFEFSWSTRHPETDQMWWHGIKNHIKLPEAANTACKWYDVSGHRLGHGLHARSN